MIYYLHINENENPIKCKNQKELKNIILNYNYSSFLLCDEETPLIYYNEDIQGLEWYDYEWSEKLQDWFCSTFFENMPADKKIKQDFAQHIKNCIYYEEKNDKNALLNEIGVVRGLSYAMQMIGVCPFHNTNTDKFLHFIDMQNKLLNR